GAVRFQFEHRFRPVRPFDQPIGCAGKAEAWQHQPLLLEPGVEEASLGACEASGEIGGAPKLEGVPTIKDAVATLLLAGAAVLVVPEPARAPARFGRVEKAPAVV